MKIILEKFNNTKTIHSKVAKWSYYISSKILNINEIKIILKKFKNLKTKHLKMVN